MSGELPRPAGSGDAAAFWESLRAGVLRLQRCGDCLALRHPPRPVCPRCSSRAIEWSTVSGRGEIWSFTIIHPPVLPAFTSITPYNAVVVRLEEGPFLVSNLIDIGTVAVGAAVELVLERIDDDLTLPRFRPARTD